MLRHIITLLTFLLLATSTPYDALKREAEKFYGEKSFARAHEVYVQASKLDLPAEERRWVELRLADTSWRADEEADHDQDSAALQKIVNDPNHDRVWAEANESLGDLTSGVSYYLAALDWWAGSDDLPLARRRYLDIIWRIDETLSYYEIPKEVLVNAIAIAQTPEDVLHARFLLASQILDDGPEGAERAAEHFEAIVAAGKTTEWYDDALFNLAQIYATGSNVVVNGEVESQPRYNRALELYRRLITEFAKGESEFRDNAQQMIDNIVSPAVALTAAGTFVPDSEQDVMLYWRNVKRVDLSLIAVDVTDVQRRKDQNWIEGIRTEGKPVVRKWSFETNDKGDHVPSYETLHLTPKLERGAYIMTASAQGATSKQLVMVTDAHILVHASPKQLQVYFSDVITGEPIANARVRVFQWSGNDQSEQMLTTNADGLAVASKLSSYSQVAVTATNGKGRQAWHSTYTYTSVSAQDGWRIYAFTDRPAYRPEETVQWKIVARTRANDVWSTPSGQRISYEITSPRGEKVASGDAKLNAFGSFWSELPLTTAMPLGEYTVRFKTVDKNGENIGAATLFRLEEYKLPEFMVTVSAPKLYRLGDTVEATIDANYYFGGPVANATVEAVVYQQPFYRYWYPWREYAWYYDPIAPDRGDTVLKRETLKTDANGRATLRIDTSRDGNDTRYRIEARVVDSSRREVRGEGNVTVTKQRYSVIAHPEHYLHRPGDPVEIDFKAIDANEQPVQTTGTVKVFRRQWRGKERVYAEEEVTQSKVATDAKGEGTFTFTPKSIGYYTVRWTSEDRDPSTSLGMTKVRDLVKTETAVWVADRTTNDLGYFTSSGVEIIVDKETLRAGQTAAVMIVSPVSGRWVVLTRPATTFSTRRCCTSTAR